MNRQEYFTNWAKKSNTTPIEFEKEYQERIDKSRADFPQMSEAEREKYILSLIQTSLKRQLSSPALKFVGMFISVDDAKDANNFSMQEAIRKGHTNPEGKAVYTEADRQVKEWKTAKVGDVIPEKIQRTSIGVFYEEKDGQPSELHIGALYDADNPTRTPPLNTWVRFRANCKNGATEKGYSMNASSVTDFKAADGMHTDISTLTSRDIIKRYFIKNACPTFKDMPNFVMKDTARPFGMTIIHGMIGDIRFSSKTGKAVIEISNPDLETSLDDNIGIMTGFLSEAIQVDFGIGSTALFVGRLSYKDEKKQYTLNVSGLVPENMVGVPSNLQKIVPNGHEEEEF